MGCIDCCGRRPFAKAEDVRRRFDAVRVFRIGRGSRDFGGVFGMFARVQGCALQLYANPIRGYGSQTKFGPDQNCGRLFIIFFSSFLILVSINN